MNQRKQLNACLVIIKKQLRLIDTIVSDAVSDICDKLVEDSITEDKPKFENGDFVWGEDYGVVIATKDSYKGIVEVDLKGERLTWREIAAELATKAQIREAHDFEIGGVTCRMEEQEGGLIKFYTGKTFADWFDIPEEIAVAKAIAEKFGATIMPALPEGKYKDE